MPTKSSFTDCAEEYNTSSLSRMKPAVFWVCCLLAGVQSHPTRDDKLRTLDLARNRELFLSALQSYFSNRGLHVDRTAPAFLLFPPKSQQNRRAVLLDAGTPEEGLDSLK